MNENGTKTKAQDGRKSVEVDSDGNELPGDWEYNRKGGYVYCAFA